jgi:hypothetical protein
MSVTQRAAADDAASATTCAICGGTESDPRLLASCYGCSRTFHLNSYAAPGTDCGDVWAGSTPDEEFTGLELYCSACLRGREAKAGGEAIASDAARRGVSEPPRREPRPPWTRRYRRLDTDAP